ncbi:MAG: endonuclease/exonuclease/phosphatase family protein [Muribaculaceae bacterium]|nr:endonuclease/exonuclease/phosphatase family protein [Muribaculaceae bacterium]MDE6135606.1 endonuclease/exonuclease/phosphatase family protein [Muribaculaceae bacterium]
MKKISYITLLLAVVALLLPGAASAERRLQVAGVAFYNFENLFDTIPNNPENRDLEFTPGGQRQWDGRKYWEKVHNLAYAISEFKTKATPYGPAIIGVSEIENRSVMEDVVNQPELRDLKLQVVHHDSPDARGVDVGLLYNPRYFKLENVTNHRLTAVSFRTRDQMCVVGQLLGQRIAVIVNHWPSRLGGQERSEPNRMAAAELSKSIADSLWRVDPNIGVIIMGDLNDDPQDKSCAQVLGAKRDSKGVGAHGFFNPFWKKLDSGVGTLAYKSSWNLFDQIILSGNLVNVDKDSQWHFYEAKVLNFDFLKDTEGNRMGYPKRTYSAGSYLGGYSDHFPTEIFLRRYIDR